MNIHRAKQILESPKEIEVHYKGDSVWIQNVDESGLTARVYKSKNPDEEMEIPVAHLEEV